MLRHACLLVLLSALSSASLATEQKQLRIAVAANFTPVLKELLPSFYQQTGIKTQLISGASGAMFLQIKHGAPFDLFLSADSRRPEQLERDGLISPNSRKTYALGQLALFSHGKIANLAELKQLDSNLKRFAIANPDIAPYGKAAKEALQHLGLWQVYQDKLITGINISQTFNQIRSKSVSMGIVANSQLVLNNLSGAVIPDDFHQSIEQQLVILKRSKNQKQAKQLSDFLQLASTQKRIASYGYIASAKHKH